MPSMACIVKPPFRFVCICDPVVLEVAFTSELYFTFLRSQYCNV